MKAISSPGARGQRAARRISKPQMEKRRRERINHSLETLRVLMLESTHNEKLKNPKVEKAEILESVVDFLKAEEDVQKDHQASKRALSVEQRPACACQSSYHDGMRTCLLRVNQFIASKSQEAGEPSGAAVRASFTLPEIPMHPTTPGHIHHPPAALPPHPLPFHHPQLSHHYLTQKAGFHVDTSNLSPAGVGHIPDPLWRPWPQ
ncbi:hairy-related 5 [Haplochromis burtoni]|uniref:Hairy-related 5 n=1 Tax=Haplochromis burtoni TaxID=8153 RepID=A0A3Q2UTE8_HAPBU|nr:hairy-related 5 [Haplochromis burtoni]